MNNKLRFTITALGVGALAAAPWLVGASSAAPGVAKPPATQTSGSVEDGHTHDPVTTEEEAKRRWNPKNDKHTKIKKNDNGTFTITRETPLVDDAP